MQDKALTVTQLTVRIKSLLESERSFQGFVLKGEVSNFVRHRTGHLYFNLKDENALIKAIMFSSSANRLLFDPKNGDKVTVTGSISLYAPQGSYSIQVNSMQMDGAGELYLKYLELKEKLKTLGWFDKPKRTLPKYPKTIGVITSPTGAVIEDITNTINRRYRLTNIILYPALVQGTNAAQSISSQIEKANNDNIADVLIIGRGGGSIEDLWGFNELATISAIYNSKIPVITAIGHETDDTISDLVSDLRAPTPTAAAELATPDTLDLIKSLSDYNNSIDFKFKNLISNHQNNLMHLVERLEAVGPKNKLENYANKLNNNIRLLNTYYSQKLINSSNELNKLDIKLLSLSPSNKLKESFNIVDKFKIDLNKNYLYILESTNKKIELLDKDLNTNYINKYNSDSQKLSHIIDILKKINPLSIMQRGFTVVKDENSKIVTTIKDIKLGSQIEIDFYDGKVVAKVDNVKENN